MLTLWFGALAACAAGRPAHAEDWRPITPDELKMTSEPLAPAVPAIYLYLQVDRDDNLPSETEYVRIKILTEEGRKYADVSIPFDKARENIRSIQARTIRPDGTIVNFDGKVYESPIVQARGVHRMAKTFTLPDVQIGGIIEYRYQHQLPLGFVFDSHWILSRDLFTKYERFSLDPYRGYTLRTSWPVGLPRGTAAPRNEHGKFRLEASDVPAFVTEEYMPPENELKQRVDFIYVDDDIPTKDVTSFWKAYGKQRFRAVDRFVDRRRAMEEAISHVIAPGDSPEVRLHKVYDRTQQIRNLSFERDRSAQEVDRDNQKTDKDVQDVWQRGYGDGLQITWLFLALARAAGLQADPVLISTRNTYFFNPNMMNPTQLNSNVVIVKLGGNDLYLDPGTPFTPFGTLPWHETGVRGLRLDKEGGSWVVTSVAAAADSRIERKAQLRLTSSGGLEGKLTVSYMGLEALSRRLEERDEDDTERKQYLEEQVKADIPSGVEVALVNSPDWTRADSRLTAVYDLKMPGWAAAAGSRALLPVGIFAERDKRAFVHGVRVHPVYFSSPHQTSDDISIELPPGWQVSSVPQPQKVSIGVADFSEAADGSAGSLHITRELTVSTLFLAAKYYGTLQDFFQKVRSGDQEQAIVATTKSQVH